ncbi:MAG: hypothetical protein R3C20_16360 [Planctomycetaceae bacterium]
MNSGKLKALLEATNRTIPDARDRLNSFAQQVVQAVDEQHAKGLPDSGPFVSLLGTRSVGDVNSPLLYAETAFPVSKGDIYVTITENATGNRSTRKISINPATDSLSDIADQFEALTGLTSTSTLFGER